MISYYIREHSMITTDEGRYCPYCNSRTGVGFYVFTRCALRINEAGFKDFCEYRNLSKVESSSKVERYIRRFTSNEIFTKKQLLKEFKKMYDKDETNKIIQQKDYCDTNNL